LAQKLRTVIAPKAAQTLERFSELADVDHPLLASFVLANLLAPPFVGPSALPLLMAFVAAAARLRDPRIVEKRQTIVRDFEHRIASRAVWVPLLHALNDAAAEIETQLPRAASADELQLEDAIEEKITELAARKPTLEGLLADVYASPTEDGPRLVLADFLLEQGDPRGELIVLQCKRSQGGLDAASAAREALLLKKHGKKWLGPLAALVVWNKNAQTRFERGFLAVADLMFSARLKIYSVVDDPSWATVEHIPSLAVYSALEAHAPLRGLRKLELLDQTVRRYAETGRVFPAVDDLAIALRDVDIATTVKAIRNVCPSVRVLEVRTHLDMNAVRTVLREAPPLHRLRIKRWGNDHTTIDDLEQKALREREAFEPFIEEVRTMKPTIPELAFELCLDPYPSPAVVELRSTVGGYDRAPSDAGT
jgi:uncharacterized protein (TIGR02996 family)